MKPFEEEFLIEAVEVRFELYLRGGVKMIVTPLSGGVKHDPRGVGRSFATLIVRHYEISSLLHLKPRQGRIGDVVGMSWIFPLVAKKGLNASDAELEQYGRDLMERVCRPSGTQIIFR